MTNPDGQFFSRRKWLGAASFGSGILGAGTAAAQPRQSADPGSRVYNIRDFGAKGDGTTLDTAAVQAAIDACSKDQGGTVLAPAGVFLIGMVELKSNVTLHVAAGAKLLGTADGKQYHPVDAIPLTGGGSMADGNTGLIYAVNAHNIVIEGMGTIDGQGSQFRSPRPGVPPPSGIGGSLRPYHLMFYRCENLTVRDLFLTSSAFHSVRVCMCKYVKMDGLRIYNRVNGNNDGFHFISCEYVHVSNCDLECQDDACALFGSCKFVTVTGCSFSTRWSVFRFGGGEAENIAVSNCIIYDTFGCPIKMQCSPGSRLENMSFSNLVMRNVTGPIYIGLGSQRPGQSGETAQKPGIVRNISFNGIHATVIHPVVLPDLSSYPIGEFNPGEIKSCMVLNGTDGYLENISFQDVHVAYPGGGTAEDAVRDIPLIGGEYFRIGVPPAYGLYARKVRGLTLNNVRLEVTAPELRPAVVFDDVEDATLSGLSAQGDRKAGSLLRFINARQVLLGSPRVLTPAAVFLQVEGAASREITVDGGDLSRAEKPLMFRAGAPQNSVRLRE